MVEIKGKGVENIELLVRVITTEDVLIAGHYICAHPAGHLEESTQFTDIEERIAYKSTEGIYALGGRPCVICGHTQA